MTDQERKPFEPAGMSDDPRAMRQRCMRTVNQLFRSQIIKTEEFDKLMLRVEEVYQNWRAKVKVGRRGRKPKPLDPVKQCNRVGCVNFVPIGQKYCCKSHTPYGHLDDT